jgi:mycothiol synthase
VTYERRPLRRQDVPAWRALLEAIAEEDGDGEHFTEADLLEFFDDPMLDLTRGSAGYFDGADMVASGLLSPQESPDPVHVIRSNGGVHPGHRGRGLGGGLLDWAQEQAIVLHRSAFPGWPLTLGSGIAATNTVAAALHEAHGFSLERYFHTMVRDLSAPVAAADLAEGLRAEMFTPGRSEDARLVRNEAFRDHWGSRETSREVWETRRAVSSFRPEFSYLAYAGDEPLGLLICHEYDAHSAARGRRELYVAIVGTRAAGRRRGIATALLSQALTAARSAGFEEASLNVDASSLTGAVGLYENIGFTITTSRAVYRKPLLPA